LDNCHEGIGRGAGGLKIKEQLMNILFLKTSPPLIPFPMALKNYFINRIMQIGGPYGTIKEQKTIGLDYGNNLMKIELLIEGTDKISAGISLQDSMGTITEFKNFLIYKQNHFDTTLSNVIMTYLNIMKDIICIILN
tara:strand:- start:87 stop:497 length:411 start_codon:yes stop_codon:yes gene_type:complete